MHWNGATMWWHLISCSWLQLLSQSNEVASPNSAREERPVTCRNQTSQDHPRIWFQCIVLCSLCIYLAVFGSLKLVFFGLFFFRAQQNGLWQWHAKHEQGAATGCFSTCHWFVLRSTHTVVYAWSMHCMRCLVELILTCQTWDFDRSADAVNFPIISRHFNLLRELWTRDFCSSSCNTFLSNWLPFQTQSWGQQERSCLDGMPH